MERDLAAIKESLREMGTTKIAHLNVDLLSHMTIVHDGLRRFGRPEHLSLAGLCHGIYGTHALHSTNVFELPRGRRDEIREVVGEQSEHLVFNFCVMTYDSLGKSVRNILKPGGQPDLRDRLSGARLLVSRDDLDELLWLKLVDLLAHLPQLSINERQEAIAAFGPFWRVVADYLGPDAVAAWNEGVGNQAVPSLRGEAPPRRPV